MVNFAECTLEQGPYHAVDCFKIFLTERTADLASRTCVTTEGVRACVSGSHSSVGDGEESLKFCK